MKIGSSPDSRNAVAATGVSKPGQPSAGGASRATAAGSSTASEKAGASVTVSELAKSVGASSAPEFNSAKVESVRAAISQGTYTVNAEAIADKLLSNAKEMLRRPQH